jgi:ubiquitin-protein ligase
VFVRYGIYKDARFKFRMTFEEFPRHAPQVHFVSEVYHPCVDPQTGLVDLGTQLGGGWNYGHEHLIFMVVEHIRLLFLDVHFYENTSSLNKPSGELFLSQPE